MYHGTSTVHLKSILQKGMLASPKKRTWEEDPDTSFYSASRVSLPGSYWTPNIMTAISSARTTTERVGGERAFVIAQIVARSTYADEDSIRGWVEYALKDAVGKYFGSAGFDLYPTVLGAMEADPTFRNKLESIFAERAHEYLRATKKHPIPKELLDKVFDAAFMRIIAHAFKQEPSKAFYRFLEGYERYIKGDPKEIRKEPEEKYLTKEALPSEWKDVSRNERNFLDALEELTKQYRKSVFAGQKYGDISRTLRMPKNIGFKGRNRIICILKEVIDSEGNMDLKNFKVVYGKVPKQFKEDFGKAWSLNFTITESNKKINSNKARIFVYSLREVKNNKELLEKLRKMTMFPKETSAFSFLNKIESEPAKNLSRKSRVLVAQLKEEVTGWLSLEYTRGLYAREEKPSYNVNVFVLSKYRRMGIASKLINKARQITAPLPLYVYPHDRKSKQFYKKHEDESLKLAEDLASNIKNLCLKEIYFLKEEKENFEDIIKKDPLFKVVEHIPEPEGKEYGTSVLYIGTGQRGVNYTLRNKWMDTVGVFDPYSQTKSARYVTRDHYIKNLGPNPEKAYLAVKKEFEKGGREGPIYYAPMERGKKAKGVVAPDIIKFGKKHPGKSVHDVAKEDPGYVAWLIQDIDKPDAWINRTSQKAFKKQVLKAAESSPEIQELMGQRKEQEKEWQKEKVKRESQKEENKIKFEPIARALDSAYGDFAEAMARKIREEGQNPANWSDKMMNITAKIYAKVESGGKRANSKEFKEKREEFYDLIGIE